MISTFKTNKEKRANIGATIKGLFGKAYAKKLINWLNPCCPFELDKMTAEEAEKFTSDEWNGSIVYVTTTNATFAAVGFYGREEGAWVKL